MSISFSDFVEIARKKKCTIIGQPRQWDNVNISLIGESSIFIFDEDAKLSNLSIIDYGGENTIHIGEKSKLTGLVKIGRKCGLTIGRNVTMTGGTKFHLAEGTKIYIGDNCMIGVDVEIFTHDYHPIFSNFDGERLNKSRSTQICDKVWIANGAKILKGTDIQSGTVIGAFSVVSGLVDSCAVYAGNPARKIRENICWDRISFNTSNLDINNISDLIL